MIVTLRASGGFFVCAEMGGGGDGVVMVNREAAGPWEQWTPVALDDGKFALQSGSGHFLCADADGECRANRDEIGPWETFTIEARGGSVAFKTYHGTYLQAPLGGGSGVKLTHTFNESMPGEWEFFVSSEAFWETMPVAKRPLIGRLRVEQKLFADDSGYRRVHFCSWFPALRILRDSPEEFYRQLDSITAAGYQGIRVFLAVGGWDDYWVGREVAPVRFQQWTFEDNHMRPGTLTHWVEAWPDYDDLLRELLQACKARKVRLHVTTGDMQIICPDLNEEIDLHRRFARICAEEGGLDVIAISEVTNEFPLNRYGSDSPESITQMGHVLDVWREAIPGILTMQGAIPQNEEPESLSKASTHGEVCAVHVTRSPAMDCIKRTLGLVWWEGDYRAFDKPYWEGEPAGPGPDSYQRQDDPAILIALYSMMALTGQASNWFQGAAVLSKEPLESEWGFIELPPLLDAVLPEDVATWQHASNQRGGIAYWVKGNSFATATYIDWDTSPPREIAAWTIYDGVGVHSGTGTPPRCTGLIVGTFA